VAKTLTLEEIERQHIVDVLEQTNWRVSGEKGAAKSSVSIPPRWKRA
jgi:hypothetical protein